MEKIAIVVGHTPNADKGAFSATLGKSEYEYNSIIADTLKRLNPDRYDVFIHTESSYGKRQASLAKRVNGVNYKLVIELHFNSSAKASATGSEVVIYRGSKLGFEYGTKILVGIVEHYGSHNRGVKYPDPKEGNRGLGFLKGMKAPAIIYEPFFGSNIINAKNFADPIEHACVLNTILSKL